MTFAEHFDVMQILVGALFAIVAWFVVRTISKVDRNQTLLFQRLSTLEGKFYELLGEHRVQTRRRRDP